MPFHPLLIAGFVTLLNAPLAAQDGAAPSPVSPDAQSAKAKKICRRVVPTGSIMPKTLCLTGSEWSELNSANGKRVEMLVNGKSSSFDTRLGL